MQTLAAVMYLMFIAYLANFVMLSAVAAKQANRPVWLFSAGDPAQRLTGWAFRLALLAAVAWPPLRVWAGGLRSDPLAAAVEGTVTSLIGHLLVAVGAAVALVSQYHMGARVAHRRRGGRARGACANGPFAISRNPVFAGQAILFVGLFLAFPDLVQLLISASVIAAASMQVRIEERVLKATFGEAYEDYAARVPRWIGRSAPSRPDKPA